MSLIFRKRIAWNCFRRKFIAESIYSVSVVAIDVVISKGDKLKLYIDKKTRQALKNAKLVNDLEIDKINIFLQKDHTDLDDLIKDMEISLETRLKIVTLSVIGNSGVFTPSEYIKTCAWEVLLGLIKR